MYQEIKKLAEEALKLQNKNFMDETFRKISQICDEAAKSADVLAMLRKDLIEGAYSLCDGCPDYVAAIDCIIGAHGYECIGADRWAALTESSKQMKNDVERKMAAVLEREFKTPDAANIRGVAPTENTVVLPTSETGLTHSVVCTIVDEAALVAATAIIESGLMVADNGDGTVSPAGGQALTEDALTKAVEDMKAMKEPSAKRAKKGGAK